MPPRPRGSTARRGYGAAHKRERERWTARVDAGLVNCARCGQPIEPGRPWDLGHNDERTGYRGPEHANSCNRRAGGANGAKVTNAMRTKQVRASREW